LANLFVAVVTVAVLLAAMSGLVQSSLTPQSAVSDSLKTARERTGEAARTAMTHLDTSVNPAGSDVEVTIENDGETALRGYSMWDLLLAYQGATGHQIQRLTYTTSASPAAGEWTVEGIYKDAGTSTAEVYQPDIVDPGEEFVIKAVLSPVVSSPSDNSLVLAVDNGVALTVTFTH